MSWSPESRWGYSTSDIAVGLDLLDNPSLGTPQLEAESEEPIALPAVSSINQSANSTYNATYEAEQDALLAQLLADPSNVPDVNLKIAKARPAVPGSWAWVAQIKYYRNGRYEFVCAGTLVADQWVLTAAQCLSDE